MKSERRGLSFHSLVSLVRRPFLENLFFEFFVLPIIGQKTQFRDGFHRMFVVGEIAEFSLHRQRGQFDIGSQRTIQFARSNIIFQLENEEISGQFVVQVVRIGRIKFDSKSKCIRRSD